MLREMRHIGFSLAVLLLGGLLAFRTPAGRGAVTTPPDRILADSLLAALGEVPGRTVPQLMLQAARSLAGTPYVGGTLEGEQEELRVFLTRTDCILFVETCLDLALTVSECGSGASFDDFAVRIARSRYRCAPPWRYSDRRHYTTEWIRAACARGEMQDLTLALGGKEYAHPIGYMGAHPDRYPALSRAASDPAAAEDLRRIRAVEDSLNRTPCTYIPREAVATCLAGVRSGDIVCFVSAVEGLDISHVGFVLVEDGRVGLLHASSAAGKVLLDPLTLSAYVARRKGIAGIKILRVAD